MTDAIERVTLTHLQIPLKEPWRTARGEVICKDAILITVESASGVGLGECSPVPSEQDGGVEGLNGCWNDLADRIAPTLIGRSFASIEEIAEQAASWTGHRTVLAGAEAACWDLLGQARHETIAELLGASAEPLVMGIESGLSVGLYPTIVDLIQTIGAHLEAGYRRVKVRIEPGRDVELVRAVRQHFGDIPLMVDAEGSFTLADLDIFRELDDHDLLMFEQPFAAHDLDGLAALQREVTTPVCLDESADSLERTAEAIRREACRIVNIKIQRVGGFGPALAMHDLCHERGVACWVGTMPELGVGQAQGLHLATLANCKYPTDIQPSTRWFVDDYVVPSIEMSAPGFLSAPTRPGLGYLVDPVKVRRYQVRHQQFGAGA